MFTYRNENLFFIFPLLLAVTSLRLQNLEDNDVYRLPQNLVPLSYDIFLNIDPSDLFEEFFDGSVTITFQLAEDNSIVENIYLHSDPSYVTITSAEMNEAENCTFKNVNNDITEIYCGNITELNNTLYIEFNGKFSEFTDGYGLVRSSYSYQGRRQFMVESFFEPTFARRAFPCFDEPDLKAIFSLGIRYPVDYTAISNTLIMNTSSADGYTTVIFEPTSKISTYLVSIFISKFVESTSISTDEGYSVKFFSRPGIENLSTKVAGDHYIQIIEALSNFTGQSYQDIGNPECYQVAIPDCYSDYIGEFGVFVYRERDILDEKEKTSTKVSQNILQNLAYKLSHQWFGGEVSTKWWSDFWANEAIPVYFKYIIPSQIDDGFEFENQFVIEVVQKSLQYDAMPFVQPLFSNESDVSNEWNIGNKLEEHNLLKGATLLHMINFMVRGEDQFKANIQYHLQNRHNANTDGQNMLEDMTQSDGSQDLRSAAESWVFTSGFPLLSVKIKQSLEKEETLTVSQKRFVYTVDNTSTLDDTKWTIPITHTTQSDKNFNTTISVYYTPNTELNINIQKGEWAIFNIQGRLPYRVNYEKELWLRIINSLKNENERTQIHTLNRAQIIDDIFNAARIGEVEYYLAFELADFLVNETEYYPWYSAFNAFSYILDNIEDDDTKANLEMYILNLMDNIIDLTAIDYFAVDDETHNINVLKRVMVLDWACKLGHYDCINFAVERFAQFKENQSSIEDYNLRLVILCNGLRYSQDVSGDWRFLWSVYLSSPSVHEQYDILNALGCAEDEHTLQSYISNLAVPSLTTEIKRQDALVVFKSVLSHPEGIQAAMIFLGSSLAYIQYIFDGSDKVYILSDMILALAEKLVTEDQLNWLQDVLSHNILNSYDDLKTRAKTLAKINNYWAKQYQDVIRDIFPSTTSTSTEPTSSTEFTSTVSDETTSIEPSPTTESKQVIVTSSFIMFIVTVYTTILSIV